MRVSVSLSDRERHHWEDLAACRTVDSELFFPLDGDKWGARWAKTVCARCPVRRQCLQTALDERHVEGIWGGMTPKERAELTRKRRAKCSTDSGYYHHLRVLHEPACDACLEAHRVATAQRKARRA